MAEITNATTQAANTTTAAQKAVENSGEATSLLDQALGPFMSLPPHLKIATVGLAGAGYLAYKWWDNQEDNLKLSASDWTDKFDKMIRLPTNKVGREKVNTLLFNQSDSAGKRTIGVIKKLDSNSTNIGGKQLKQLLNDKNRFEEAKENGDLSTKAVSYEVVEGRKKFDRIINTIFYKLAGMFGKGSNSQAEYFDIPLKYIKVTDNGVVIKENVKLFKDNGLWQTDTIEGQQRLAQLTWLDTQQNSQEELQKLPEFWSDYNMNVAGRKNLENTKSQNMREYKREEKLNEKGEAMEE